MGAKSAIEWTDATWTPIQARDLETGYTGVHCEKVSPACKNCYAERFNLRCLPHHGTGYEFTILNRPKVEIFVNEKILLQSIKWKRPRKIFVCSQTDLFGEFVPDELIDRVFAVMALCPQHTFQVLTKRPERMQAYISGISADPMERLAGDIAEHAGYAWGMALKPDCAEEFARRLDPDNGGWPLPNVWLGVTAEHQEWADTRIPLLLQTPAAKRFVSAEPLLGPLDLRRYLQIGEVETVAEGRLFPQQQVRRSLHQIITGGESGPGARPSHPDWFRSLRDQCVAAGAPFFFKQWGEWSPVPKEPISGRLCTRMVRTGDASIDADGTVHIFDGRISVPNESTGFPMCRVGKKAAGRLLDGREWSQFPEVRQ